MDAKAPISVIFFLMLQMFLFTTVVLMPFANYALCNFIGQRCPIPAQPAMLVIMRASIVNAVIAKMRRVRLNTMAVVARM